MGTDSWRYDKTVCDRVNDDDCFTHTVAMEHGVIPAPRSCNGAMDFFLLKQWSNDDDISWSFKNLIVHS